MGGSTGPCGPPTPPHADPSPVSLLQPFTRSRAMLTGSAGKPQGTTPSTRMAAARSSPSPCTATSEVGAAGGCPPLPSAPRGQPLPVYWGWSRTEGAGGSWGLDLASPCLHRGPSMDHHPAQPPLRHAGDGLQRGPALPGRCGVLERFLGRGLGAGKCLRVLRAAHRAPLLQLPPAQHPL